MDSTYIFSQILVVMAYIILGIGLGKKNRKQILFYGIIYNILIGIHYIFLSAIMGTIASIIGLLRNIIFYYNEQNKKKNSYSLLYVFFITTILITIAFYKTPIDILPCVLTLIGIYSYWNSNTKITRIGNILVSICYIIYSIPIRSYFTTILELYTVIATLIGYFKHEIKNSNSK